MYRLGKDASDSDSRRSVLIVGAGALGCPAAATLVAAGVRVTITDFDRVERANLPSQFLYGEDDVGRPKAEAAAERLRARGARAQSLVTRVDASNVDALVGAHGFVVDACDDPATKLALNDAAVRAGRAFCYGGVSRTGGLVLAVEPGRSACVACAFPPPRDDATDAVDPPERDDAAGPRSASDGGCSQSGVLAPVAAVLGTLQALEAMAALGVEGAWRPGRLAVYELRGRRWRFVSLPRDPGCTSCGAPLEARQRRTQSCRF